ncbi:MAG: NAD-binding protein [Myxococcota bacterium]|nr:NAD-binding protein [Myxococcota bacterium]
MSQSEKSSWSLSGGQLRKNFQHVIVIGAGAVGERVALSLVREEGLKQVTVIDEVEEKLSALEERSGDLQCIRGHGADPSILEHAQIEKADLVLAVTNSDEVNLLASLSARQSSKSARIFARVRSPFYTAAYAQKMGIDELLNPEELCVGRVAQMVRSKMIFDSYTDWSGQLLMLGVRLPQGSPLTQISLADFGEKVTQKICVAAWRSSAKGSLTVPSPHIPFPADSEVYLCLKQEEEEATLRAVGCESPIPDGIVLHAEGALLHLMLKTLINTTELSSRQLTLTLLGFTREESAYLEREYGGDFKELLCFHRIEDISLVEGSSTANLFKNKAFIGLSEDHEESLSLALLAREHGAEQSIILTRSPLYQRLARQLGIDAAPNPQLLVSNILLRHIGTGRSVSHQSLSTDETLELTELVVKADHQFQFPISAFQGKGFPRDAVIGMILRDGRCIWVEGDTQLEHGDRLLVIAPTGIHEAIEDFWRHFNDH